MVKSVGRIMFGVKEIGFDKRKIAAAGKKCLLMAVKGVLSVKKMF